jgi:molecular chaperone HscC
MTDGEPKTHCPKCGSRLAQNCREDMDVYWTHCTSCSWLRVDESPKAEEGREEPNADASGTRPGLLAPRAEIGPTLAARTCRGSRSRTTPLLLREVDRGGTMSIVGIDLGTTYSSVAVWKDGQPRIIANVLGDELTPSVVGLDDNGEALVGQAAKERLITHPELTAATFKRYMGTGRIEQLGSRGFRPEELSSFVLRSLKSDAEAFLGEVVDEAVISVPAYFNDVQRKATRAAGELAGLKVERLINEPTAAAMAFSLHEAANESTFLVFDLGGGTFDVSVVELFDGVMEVHASAGDNFLGGEDFTSALAAAFLGHAGFPEADLERAERSRVHKQAECAKLRLSVSDQAEMKLRLKGRDVAWVVSRTLLESLTGNLIERMRRPVERAMRDAKLRVADLDGVVLVGGATRMPLVRALAAKLFGRFPLTQVSPDEAVAIGAAIQAGLKSRERALAEVVLTDTCPHSLGVAVAVPNPRGEPTGREFSPILERNTVVPASREQVYSPMHDSQTSVVFEVYQGESRRLENDIRLGSLTLPLPAGKARERQLVVRFTYDINGLLEVDTRVGGTQLRRTLVIEGNPGLLTPEQIEQRITELQAIKIHPRDQMENRAVMARAERIFEESLGERRTHVGRLTAQFEAVLVRQDAREIEKARQDFIRGLDEIEEGWPW